MIKIYVVNCVSRSKLNPVSSVRVAMILPILRGRRSGRGLDRRSVGLSFRKLKDGN